MIRLKNVRCKVVENINIYEVASKRLGVKVSDIKMVKIHKKSIDARSKMLFSYVFDLDVLIDNEKKYLGKNVEVVKDVEYELPASGNLTLSSRPIVVGAGPAGLFASYMLALHGFKPLIVERGSCIEKRIKDVELFWKSNKFNENSNVLFGLGGAGTFSDGKLNTLVKDKSGRMKKVFEIFEDCGAPSEIMYEHMPHIGTDVLRTVVVNLRKKIEALGGVFKFDTTLRDIKIEDDRIKGIYTKDEFIACEVLVLAIGHSARDTFKMLYNKGLDMESKPFAVGIRIVHPQELIDKNQYPVSHPFLPPASYKLTYKAKNNHGVYSFCMCPGGYVVNASSSTHGICINGMSDYKRDSGFANSAIVVTVGEKDYGEGVFAGLNFQENIESLSYKVGKGLIPIQKYGDYKNNTLSDVNITNQFKGSVTPSNINEIFPPFINESLKEGIDYFNKHINGFNGDDVIIAAPEARTSSPVRIKRGEFLQSNIKGIYPCGEGSGYAGGITTSAIDGIKVFENIYKIYKG